MIPKAIYFFCHSQENTCHYVNTWKSLNPQYRIQYYDVQKGKEFLSQHYDDIYVEIYNYLSDKSIQSDFWRLCILYKYGGAYADLHIEPLVSLDEYISNDCNFVTCSTSVDSVKYSYNPHFIMCVANNKIIFNCINWYIQKYKYRNVTNFGRWGIMQAMSKTLHLYYNKQSGVYKYGDYNIQILQERIDDGCYIMYDNKRVLCKRDIRIHNKGISEQCNEISEQKKNKNKMIYMTYHKQVPSKVSERWEKINPKYSIELSLDADCIAFLSEHFNEYITNLFKMIPKGMYKADLWRLCKLYHCGGVYADVDLVPFLNIDTELDPNIGFYSCLSIMGKSVFQAFMVNTTSPKNPLILAFLISFLLNNPFHIDIGPTYDMYNVLNYNLGSIDIQPNKRYDMNMVKISVPIGTCKSNVKLVDLHYFPCDHKYKIIIHPHGTADRFAFDIKNHFLIVQRTDEVCGWGHNHSCDICIDSKESFLLFPEHKGIGSNMEYVSYKNKKILNSRDSEYSRRGGW